eukprot:8238412-Lingulodinium_polyedra.AAC.1
MLVEAQLSYQLRAVMAVAAEQARNAGLFHAPAGDNHGPLPLPVPPLCPNFGVPPQPSGQLAD